ncbi:hypothetical protein V1525DRAFT_428130 [Lipomyces kononenkoae]|uniref:Uncharacterized protein n=1 Tax=Lipomyces kononenkoae TaxID=34357 RepID=A0ACC3SV41_LIPKO
MATNPTDTTNLSDREYDIERKIQLYGIYHAFKIGRMPSNNQIDVALNSFLATDFMNTDSRWQRKLSDEGRLLLKDFANVVENAKILVLSKNYDNLFQEFIWHSSQMSAGERPQLGVTTTGASDAEKDRATLYDNDVVKGLRDLGTLIITNGQFRKLLSDGITLLRDMAADVAIGVAQRVRPTEEQIGKIDQPAPEDTWHTTPNQRKLDLNLGRGREEPPHEVGKTLDDKNQRVNQAKDYLKNKIPKDRRDQVLLRFKKAVVEIQGHPDYKNAIDAILNLIETYTGHVTTATDVYTSKVKKISENDHLQQAQFNLKASILIERFANSTSMDDLLDTVGDLYVDADKDPVLKTWFRDLSAYIRKVLEEEGYILSDSARDEFNLIYDRGNDIFTHRYGDYSDQFEYEFTYLIDKFQADPLNQQFGDSITTLFHDLATDEKGEVVFKKYLVNDITDVILPEVFKKIRYLPLPRIEYAGRDLDAVVENLVIESANLFPNMIEIQNHSFLRWGRMAISKGKHSSFIVNVSGIQCDLKDVSYYIHKKAGFPQISDTGVADFFVPREGLGIKMRLSTCTSGSRKTFFNLDEVQVKIKDLGARLKKSNHMILFTIFRPLLITIVKPGLKRTLQKQIRETFNQLDETAYNIYINKKHTAADVRQNPDIEKEPSTLDMYWEATKSELLRQKEHKRELEAKGIKPEGKVNVAMTQDDSILKDVVLPTGFTSAKVAFFKKMAAEGDRWKSKVFSLGSAAPSKEFPVPREISRRSRETAAQKIDIVNAPSKSADRSGDSEQRGSTTDARATKSSGPASVVEASPADIQASQISEGGESGYESGLDASGTSLATNPMSTGRRTTAESTSDFDRPSAGGSNRDTLDALTGGKLPICALPGARSKDSSAHQ